jgi:hypothetical protein
MIYKEERKIHERGTNKCILNNHPTIENLNIQI